MMHQCKTHHNKVTWPLQSHAGKHAAILDWRHLFPKSLWQNNWRRVPHLSRHFLLKILVSSVRLHSRNALYKARDYAVRLETLVEDDTVTFRSPYSVFFGIRMVVMFVGFGYLACRVTVFVSPAAFTVTLTLTLKIPALHQLHSSCPSLFLWSSLLVCWCLSFKDALCMHIIKQS